MKNEIELNRTASPARRWLVVDDSEEILAMLAAALRAFSSAEIVCCNSPIAALEAFTADPQSFDVVITDFDMPGMNGIELGARIRKFAPAQKLVLATGSNIFTEAEALYNGFRTVLAKPFSLAALEGALRIAGVLEKDALCV